VATQTGQNVTGLTNKRTNLLRKVGNGHLRQFLAYVNNDANKDTSCGFFLQVQRMDQVQMLKSSWRSTPAAELIDELGLGSLYSGGLKEKSEAMAEARSALNNQRAPKSGVPVCCPTVFRAHRCASTCLPAGVPLGGGAPPPQEKAPHQRTHAANSKFLAYTMSQLQAERGQDATDMSLKQACTCLLRGVHNDTCAVA
jgi:hypothetical protein